MPRSHALNRQGNTHLEKSFTRAFQNRELTVWPASADGWSQPNGSSLSKNPTAAWLLCHYSGYLNQIQFKSEVYREICQSITKHMGELLPPLLKRLESTDYRTAVSILRWLSQLRSVRRSDRKRITSEITRRAQRQLSAAQTSSE